MRRFHSFIHHLGEMTYTLLVFLHSSAIMLKALSRVSG